MSPVHFCLFSDLQYTLKHVQFKYCSPTVQATLHAWSKLFWGSSYIFLLWTGKGKWPSIWISFFSDISLHTVTQAIELIRCQVFLHAITKSVCMVYKSLAESQLDDEGEIQWGPLSVHLYHDRQAIWRIISHKVINDFKAQSVSECQKLK